MIHPVYEYVRIYYAVVSYNPFFRSDGFRFVAGGKPLAGGMENEEQREKSHIYIIYIRSDDNAVREKSRWGRKICTHIHKLYMYMHNFSRCTIFDRGFRFFLFFLFKIDRMPGERRQRYDIKIYSYPRSSARHSAS